MSIKAAIYIITFFFISSWNTILKNDVLSAFWLSALDRFIDKPNYSKAFLKYDVYVQQSSTGTATQCTGCLITVYTAVWHPLSMIMNAAFSGLKFRIIGSDNNWWVWYLYYA